MAQPRRFSERVAVVFGANSQPLPEAFSQPSLFDGFPAETAAEKLRQQGFCSGLQLPLPLVRQIFDHASITPCVRHSEDRERFRIGEVQDGFTPSGAPVGTADVVFPGCDAVDRVSCDATLVEIARLYLGYRPQRVARRLFWSPVSSLPDQVRRECGQTIDYHYDIEPHNSLYVFFYITGADHNSGSHVTVARSHKPKPLPIIWSSAFQPAARVLERYGADSPVVIEGGPGYGFLEDPACFHKALPPTGHDRLVLQLRYS
ncbi:MAG TPA: hypothetical protein VF194_19315 [Ferrovibrio sp.]|uniref:hypothetical protein n=1 Tax=Ferrovibrio sp. TaxID=1917215 RepID=UPI002ED5E629